MLRHGSVNQGTIGPARTGEDVRPRFPLPAAAGKGKPRQDSTAVARMREILDFNPAARRECSTWTDALRQFIRWADEAAVLVMRRNNRRRLDSAEFRGFPLCDPLTPLIFVNGQDTIAAQMFTLAQELAHIWLGVWILSNPSLAPKPGLRREAIWCSAVAA